jgi:hypothetical protein
MKITAARITPMPKKFSDPMPQVFVTTEDGHEQLLFEFYPDEISFRAQEFVGLTMNEARDLKRQKDVEYLRS